MKKVLVFRGGWDGHEPVKTSEILAKTLEGRGVELDMRDDQECLLEPGLHEKYAAIIPVWTMGKISWEAASALFEAVKAGTGLAGWHGGMCDAFRENTHYQFMTGGQWVEHPGGTEKYRVNIVSDDPIVAGIEDFDVESEHYYMHVDPGNEVLATTQFNGRVYSWIAGVVMPVVWKRAYGAGRVFYCSLGHNAADFINFPQIPEIIARGVLWAAGEQVR